MCACFFFYFLPKNVSPVAVLVPAHPKRKKKTPPANRSKRNEASISRTGLPSVFVICYMLCCRQAIASARVLLEKFCGVLPALGSWPRCSLVTDLDLRSLATRHNGFKFVLDFSSFFLHSSSPSQNPKAKQQGERGKPNIHLRFDLGMVLSSEMNPSRPPHLLLSSLSMRLYPLLYLKYSPPRMYSQHPNVGDRFQPAAQTRIKGLRLRLQHLCALAAGFDPEPQKLEVCARHLPWVVPHGCLTLFIPIYLPPTAPPQ